MIKKTAENKVFLVFFAALALRFVLIFTPPHVDIFNHVDWGIRFWEYGPKDFYEQIFWGLSWPNQPIGSILLFAAVAKINEFLFQFFWQLNLLFAAFPSFIFPFLERSLHIILLKLPFVLADLATGVLIYKIIKNLFKKEKLALLGASLFLFNPALIYNSTVWGQTDSLVNFLGLLGLWGVWKKKYFLGILAFLGSLYFKLSLIIFAPLLGLILWRERSSWRKIAVSALVAVGFFLLISLPFVHHGNVFSWLWYLYTNRVLPRQGEMLSGNAFNFWTLLYSQDLALKESIPFLGRTAKVWGKLFFLLVSGLFTLFSVKRGKGDKRDRYYLSDYFYLGMLYAFAAFLFLTNMHERHLYPVFPLLAILAVKKKELLTTYFVLSLIHLVNLYNLWWQPRVEALVLLLSGFGNLLPRILSLVNLGIFVVFVKLFLQDEKRSI